MKAIPALLLASLLGLTLPGFAQPATPAPPAAPVVYPPSPEPDPTMLRAMKSKLFEIKYRDPRWLGIALRPLGSGVRGYLVDSTERGGINTISVRDFPENLAAIEEAIKRLDVPSAARLAPNVELTLHVLFASKGAVSESGLPSDLQEVVKQLKNTLAYRSYTLAASFIERAQIPEDGLSETRGMGHLLSNALGTGDGKGSAGMKVEWGVNGLKLVGQPEVITSYQVTNFWLDLSEESDSKTNTLAKFRTPLTLKEGERVVVGASVIKDHGVVVVLTARRVN